jgi:antitoxin ParD1/3/4
MNITLDSSQTALIEEFVASGEFASADDVVAEALRLLASQTEDVEYLRAEIAQGDADIEAGRVVPFDLEEFKREARSASARRG